MPFSCSSCVCMCRETLNGVVRQIFTSWHAIREIGRGKERGKARQRPYGRMNERGERKAAGDFGSFIVVRSW